MLNLAAYIEFRRWHSELLGRQPSTWWLAWDWLLSNMGGPRIATVRLKELKHPVALRPWSSDLYVFEQILVDHEYGVDVKIPASIVDIGANIGLASVYFANRFPNASILAIEPELDNFKMLQHNTREYRNIQCIRAGVWERNTQLNVANPEAKSWAFQLQEPKANDQSEAIQAISLDTLIEQYHDGVPFDLVKMDIEGAEKAIFAQGGKWLDRAKTIFVECHERYVHGTEATVMQSATQHGYSARRSGEYFVFERLEVGTPLYE